MTKHSWIKTYRNAYAYLKGKLPALTDFTTCELQGDSNEINKANTSITTHYASPGADTTHKDKVLARLARPRRWPTAKLRWAVGVRGSPLLTAIEVALAYAHNQLAVHQLTFAGWHYGALCADSGRQETSSAWVNKDLLTLHNKSPDGFNVSDYTKGLYKAVYVNVRGCETYGVTTVCAAAKHFQTTPAYTNALTQLRMTALHSCRVTDAKWEMGLKDDKEGGGTSFAYKINTAHAFLQSTATATEKWHDKRVLFELQTRLLWVVSAWFPPAEGGGDSPKKAEEVTQCFM